MVIILFYFKNKEIKDLFQWSRDIVLKFDPIYAGEEAHFSNNKVNSLNKKIDENGEVTIPNILLTESMPIEVYLFITDEQEQYTKKKKILPVIARPKPEDYIYTEEESKIWDNKVDIFQGKENSKKILSTNENGEVITEISVDEIITNKDIPRPTSADNGMYLGCENGAATWKPVEASGGAVAGARTICVPTELESGIIPSGEAAWTSYRINTTLADIQEWDEFLVEWYGMSTSCFFSFKPTGSDVQDAAWVISSSKTMFLYEWVDSDHTHVRVKSYRSGVGGVINGIESNKGALKSDYAQSVLCIADWSSIDPTAEMCLLHNEETNADIIYKVWGITKKEA